VRTAYERFSCLDEVLARVREMSTRTVIFDVEPLVASWNSGQAALDQGVELVLGRAGEVPEVQLICFATNSLRRPSSPPAGASMRVVYLASADKPVRTGFYQGFPRPGVVVGDQIATDGILARRLGYTFAQYRPPGRVPARPRLMNGFGQLVRPILFSRPG
jgi:predicted HAD superfamily phosphohydrolase YqeG